MLQEERQSDSLIPAGLRNNNMSAVTLLLSWILMAESVSCWSQYRRNVSAEVGQSVFLPCQHPDNFTVGVVKWSRTDLGDEYVLLYRDEQMDKSYQNPSFRDRVDLQDRLMEDGDVTLVLEDARTNDAGTYECRVVQRGGAKLDIGPICIVRLDVAPPPPVLPGDKDGTKEDEDEEEDYGYDEKLEEGAKEEKIQDGGNKEEGKEGSIVLPVLVIILSVVAFLAIRGRCSRSQTYKAKFLP